MGSFEKRLSDKLIRQLRAKCKQAADFETRLAGLHALGRNLFLESLTIHGGDDAENEFRHSHHPLVEYIDHADPSIPTPPQSPEEGMADDLNMDFDVELGDTDLMVILERDWEFPYGGEMF